MRESAQRIICNKQHSITEQVCRTLLMASDRLGNQTLDLTHDQLAIAIGCRREAVSISAGKLQSDGVIRYGYGKITITDRAALEYRSCECYPVIREVFAKFLAAEESDRFPEMNAGFGYGRKA
nr:helix-turn-helix domain-containing protein [Altererythrobacter sp. KTW20L]